MLKGEGSIEESSSELEKDGIASRLRCDASARALLLVMFAYGLFLECTSVVLWGGYLQLLGMQLPAINQYSEFFVRNAFLPLVLLVSALLAYMRPHVRAWRSPFVVWVLFCVGALLVWATSVQLIGGWGVVVTGALFGAGSGLMFCNLQEIVADRRVFDAGLVVFAAAGVSALLFFVICLLPGAITFWVMFLVFVPATVLLTRAAEKGTARLSGKQHPMFEVIPSLRGDRRKEAAIELWRPLLCVASSAFVVGIVRFESVGGSGSLGQTNVSNMIGLLIASAILLASWTFIYRRVTLNRLYKILFPLTATAFLFLPFLDGTFRQFVTSFVFVVFSVTASLMVVSCVRTARSQVLPPVLVYGLFAGAVYACSLLGSFVGSLADMRGGIGLTELAVVALVAVYVLSMAMVAPQRKGEGSLRQASQVPFSAMGSVVERPVETDIVSARCAVAVERYALSPRESDVVVLLAHGRDVPYIAEELVLSKNTVRSHIKNIFTKTGVHSRQELIDLLEAIEA